MKIWLAKRKPTQISFLAVVVLKWIVDIFSSTNQGVSSVGVVCMSVCLDIVLIWRHTCIKPAAAAGKDFWGQRFESIVRLTVKMENWA